MNIEELFELAKTGKLQDDFNEWYLADKDVWTVAHQDAWEKSFT